jgi:hypothetical protein
MGETMGERRRAQLVALGNAGEVREVVGRKGRHDLDRSAARQAQHGHAVKSPTYDGALTARGAKRGRANSWAARPTGRRAEVAHGGKRREVRPGPPQEGVRMSLNPRRSKASACRRACRAPASRSSRTATAAHADAYKNQPAAGRRMDTSENRGVPSSSLGLAILERPRSGGA